MEPKIVQQGQMPPAQCLFSGNQDGPFIDTGVLVPWHRPYGYIAVNYVEDLARELLGMVPAETVELLRDQLASYEEKVAELQAFVDATVEYQNVREKELA